jgi:general secretion pathway protein D
MKHIIQLITLASLLLAFSANALMLNLKNTDIRTFINTVAMSSGKNFMIDPRVKGTVNIIGTKEIDDEELYNVFLTIMKVYGYVVIEGENITRVVPKSLTKSDSAFVGSNATDAIVTKIIALDNVDATQIVPIVRPLMSAHGMLSVYAPSNSMVVIDTGSNIARLENLLLDLDKPIGSNFEFVPIKYASANNIATIIKTLMAKNAPPVTVDNNNNQLIIGGREAQKLQVRLLVAEMDKENATSGSTSIIYLKNASAKEILPILQSISQHTITEKTKKGDKTKVVQSNIQADEATNSIIITGDAETKQMVRGVIEKLDVRRAQVLIEAVIAEISSSDAQKLGIDWAANTNNVVGLSNLSGILPSILSATNGNASSAVNALSSGGLNLAAGDYDSDTKKGFAGIVNALNGIGNANILSAPSILTLDNKEAEIVVGQEVPFITNKQVTNAGNPFQNFERKDVGLKLTVKPQVDNGNAVKLEIAQEISNVLPSSSASDLITSKRSLKTSVIVEDGKMLVLGGLIDDAWRNSETKIPLLGSIPVLGKLFSYDTESKEKRNLLIFIRPTILKDQILAEEISMQKYQMLRAKQLIQNEDFDMDNILKTND